MEYEESKMDWDDSDMPSLHDLQRMERNIAYLRELLR